MTDASSSRPGAASVSVIVPVFNAATTLERAVASIAAQTQAPGEIVLVNDASSDGSRQLIERLAAADERIRILDLTENAGPARARNLAIQQATGQWLALLDADDAWHPRRLQLMLAVAAAGDVDLVFDGLTGVDPDTFGETGPLFPAMPASLDASALLEAQAPGTTYNFGYLKPLIRRDFAAQAGVTYREDIRTGEDLVYYLELILSGARTGTIADPLYLYTLPTNAAGRSASRFSHTRPKDRALHAALSALGERYEARMAPSVSEALHRRLAYLTAIAPISEFHDARLRGEWARMITLILRERTVRSAIVQKMSGRRGAR